MPGNRPVLVGVDAAPSAAARPMPVADAAPALPPGQALGLSSRVTARAESPASPGASRPRGARFAGRRGKALLRLISPLAVLGLWQLVSGFGVVSIQRLPPPTEVWSTAVSLVTTNSAAYGTLQSALLVSLERAAVGFAFGATVGLSLAIIAGLSRIGETAVNR